MPTGDTLFDPIRKRDVLATPEEYVRQAVLQHFLKVLGVPPRLLVVEFDLRNIDAQKRGRLDVVAFTPGGQGLVAWAIAECKAPHIAVDESTARQLERYIAVIPSSFLMATNGGNTTCLMRNATGGFQRIAQLPIYPGIA
jgi:hypothetical protein